MCTSFVYRGQDTIIAMNFDNNGMKYAIDTKNPQWFVVLVDGGRGKQPSFGVDDCGRFFNNLVVDSNDKGLYRRPSNKVTHTTQLIKDILNGCIQVEHLDDYLSKVEVVNAPNWSCHNMICDVHSNTWAVEPGRGNLYNSKEDSRFFAMTNFSLWDHIYEHAECDCNRYKTVTKELEQLDDLDIESAFKILNLASQRSGEWITSFSLVFSKNHKTVYYCLNGNFNDISEFRFSKGRYDEIR